MGNWGQRPPYGQGHPPHPQNPYAPRQQQTAYAQPPPQYLYQQQFAQQQAHGYRDPRYVGPQWAAPGPQRHLQPRKKGGTSVVLILLFVFIGIPALFVVGIMAIAIIVAM